MKTLFTLLVLCSCAATAMAQGFGARCNTLASETRIQVLFDQPAHPEHLAPQVLELGVEAPGNVVTEAFGFHGVAP